MQHETVRRTIAPMTDRELYILNGADEPEQDWDLEDIEQPELVEVLANLNQTIAELRLQLQSHTLKPTRQWYPANDENAKLLGYDSYRQLWEAIDSGLLRTGKNREIADRRKPNSTKPLYYFHLQRCLDRLEQLPGERI
jgi:hypothetical protein